MEMNVKSHPVVAIVTGALGAEFIATMNKRRFPVGQLKALAGLRSAGKTIGFRGQAIRVEELTEGSFEGVDIVLFSVAALSPESSRRSR
jgi:aspartate-semialdehyde dehydrogenase